MFGEDINQILRLDDSSPSLEYWNILLNFFEQNKETLGILELRTLRDECERCREYWNKRGMSVQRNDVYPNVYDYFDEEMRKLEQLSYRV